MSNITTSPPALPPEDTAISIAAGNNSVHLSRFATVGLYILAGMLTALLGGAIVFLSFHDPATAGLLWETVSIFK